MYIHIHIYTYTPWDDGRTSSAGHTSLPHVRPRCVYDRPDFTTAQDRPIYIKKKLRLVYTVTLRGAILWCDVRGVSGRL